MRKLLLLLTVLAISGCGNKNAALDSKEMTTRLGVITAVELVELDQSNQNFGFSPRIEASISSDRGLTIGLGLLLSKVIVNKAAVSAVRYQIEFPNDDELTLYDDGKPLEIGDCVEVQSHPEQKTPPRILPKKVDCLR